MADHDAEQDIENHPVLRAAKMLVEIHKGEIDKIQNRNFKHFKKNDAGIEEDVTAQVLGEHVSNVNKAEELINRVRTEKVFTSPSVEIIRELDLPLSEESFQEAKRQEGVHAAQVQEEREIQAKAVAAKEADEDPASVVHLPGDTER